MIPNPLPKIQQVVEIRRQSFGTSAIVLCDDGSLYDITLIRQEGHPSGAVWVNHWEPISLTRGMKK